jgi:hypothetical protein
MLDTLNKLFITSIWLLRAYLQSRDSIRKTLVQKNHDFVAE